MTAPPIPSRRHRAIADYVVVERVRALGGVDLVEANFPTRATHLHSHEEAEIGVFVSGHRLVRCRGRQYRASAGSVVVFRPGEFHAGEPLKGSGSNYRSFLVRREVLETVCGWTGPGWLAEPVLDDSGLAAELLASHRIVGRGTGTLGTDRLRTALATLWRRHRRPELVPTDESDAVRRVREYLEQRYASPIRLATLAELAELSVFHLIRSFRAATGLPPYAYLEQVRVNRAIQLLRVGYPVSRVAFLTGFADQSHLTRFFKRLIGVPPGQYQRSARGAA